MVAMCCFWNSVYPKCLLKFKPLAEVMKYKRHAVDAPLRVKLNVGKCAYRNLNVCKFPVSVCANWSGRNTDELNVLHKVKFS